MMPVKKQIVLYIENWFDVPVWERDIFLEEEDYQGFYEAVQNFFDDPITEVEWYLLQHHYPDLACEIEESCDDSERPSLESIFEQPCSIYGVERVSEDFQLMPHTTTCSSAISHRYKIDYALIS
jgi:hypothetical protein